MIGFTWLKGGDKPAKTAAPLLAAESVNPEARPAVPNAKRVLIVDDDAVFVRATSTKLRAAGFQVRSAQDASEAITSLRDDGADAILLDVDFPPDVCSGGMASWDGFQIMDWLRGLPTTGDTRFIMVSSSDTPEYRRRAEKLGAVAYLQKPVHNELLRSAISGG